MWSFDSIKISGQPKTSIAWLYKARRSPVGIRDGEWSVVEFGNGVLKRGRSFTFHMLSGFSH